jgi:hypothetical protein
MIIFLEKKIEYSVVCRDINSETYTVYKGNDLTLAKINYDSVLKSKLAKDIYSNKIYPVVSVGLFSGHKNIMFNKL